MQPVEIRSQLVEALRLDMIGPDAIEKLGTPDEVLPQSPSRWYLTGFLVPLDAGEEQRAQEGSDEELDEMNEAGGADDKNTPEPAAARRAYMPSSIGMSILVPVSARQLTATVRWGDYKQVVSGQSPVVSEGDDSSSRKLTIGTWQPTTVWQRTPHEEQVVLNLPQETPKPEEKDVPGSNGLRLVLSVRPVNSDGADGGLPVGTRSVSVFLVNRRRPAPDETRDEAFTFQTQLEAVSDVPLVPRPNLRSLGSSDWDERVGDLQYRDVCEFAVGHSVATDAVVDDCHCRLVRTCWIPEAEVERVAPAPISGIELSMDALAQMNSVDDAKAKLGSFVGQYRDWINRQRTKMPQSPAKRKETAEELLRLAGIAADRIERGIALLAEPKCLEAFRIANLAMAAAARRRFGVMQGKAPATIKPEWRPFQLAFILMNLPGIADPLHADRDVVDLLFFPTGGGKTEAYLGLAAFTLVLRRLENPGIASSGLSVLMRYTLRLLTLDQLSRAATLICALELERQKDVEKLGEWPFEIGLWVGKAATPNVMGVKGDTNPDSARAKTIAFKNDDRKPAPIPLEECPWCGEKFKANSFQLRPNPDSPIDPARVVPESELRFHARTGAADPGRR